VSEALSARSAKGGRIVLDTFRSANDPMLRSWLLFRAQLLPDLSIPPPVTPHEPDDERYLSLTGHYGVWRILASNNRELGRGAMLHTAPDEALAFVLTTQALAGALHVVVVRGSQPMSHGWVLSHDDNPVMISSRWYESASEANAASRTARAGLASAKAATSVNVSTNSGRRHRRALDIPSP
jgi:hypothetical protein